VKIIKVTVLFIFPATKNNQPFSSYTLITYHYKKKEKFSYFTITQSSYGIIPLNFFTPKACFKIEPKVFKFVGNKVCSDFEYNFMHLNLIDLDEDELLLKHGLVLSGPDFLIQ
jgi:hypothetical protein